MSILISPDVLIEETCNSCSRFHSGSILSDTRSDGSAALFVAGFFLSRLLKIAVYPIYPVNVFVETVITHLEAYLGDEQQPDCQSCAQRSGLYYSIFDSCMIHNSLIHSVLVILSCHPFLAG